MSHEQVENRLLQFLRHRPFIPFVVELQDGRTLFIDQPSIAIGGGGGSFFSPTFDIISFTWGEVRAIREASHEATI